MITDKTVCRINQSILYFTFLPLEFIDTVLLPIVFAIFVNKISITCIISSHAITELSAIFLKYFLFSQVHVLRSQL